MAQVSKRWRLNMYMSPTEMTPSRKDLAEALYALGIEASEQEVREAAGSPLAGAVVALVKHLAHVGGSYVAVDLDGPSFLDESAQSPRIEDVSERG